MERPEDSASSAGEKERKMVYQNQDKTLAVGFERRGASAGAEGKRKVKGNPDTLRTIKVRLPEGICSRNSHPTFTSMRGRRTGRNSRGGGEPKG